MPAYFPSTAELVNIVAKDLLRYSLVLPLNYVDGVKGLEKFLLGRGGLSDCRFNGHVLWHNYWSPVSHQTTFMGLVALVTVSRRLERLLRQSKQQPVAVEDHGNLNHLLKELDGFTLQVQIHTPRSHELVQGRGHLIYEIFRNERCVAAVDTDREVMPDDDQPEDEPEDGGDVQELGGEQEQGVRVRLRVVDPRPKRMTWKTQVQPCMRITLCIFLFSLLVRRNLNPKTSILDILLVINQKNLT